jgi:hypothetical protein
MRVLKPLFIEAAIQLNAPNQLDFTFHQAKSEFAPHSNLAWWGAFV